MTELAKRRRAIMACVEKYHDFVQIEYIQCPPSSPKDAGIVLPQVLGDVIPKNSTLSARDGAPIIVDADFPDHNAIVIATTTDTTPANPSFGKGFTYGFTIEPSQNPVGRTLLTGRRAYNQNGYTSNRLRIGGWTDNSYSGAVKIYGVQIYQNGTMIANYIPGYQVSTNKTGVYDKLTGTFVPQISGVTGFVRGPVV